MTIENWRGVDQYLESKLATESEYLDSIIKRNQEAGLPAIDVSPTQGKMLQLLVSATQSDNVLEIGTLGGYKYRLDGQSDSEWQYRDAGIGIDSCCCCKRNLQELGVAGRVDIRIGPAIDSLRELKKEIENEQRPLFDFVFIDADKESCQAYLECCLDIARTGATIIVDNIIRDGEVTCEDSDDPRVQGVRKMIDFVSNDQRITATGIQTVGTKGYDGWMLATLI